MVTIPDLARLVGGGILAFGHLELIMDTQTAKLEQALELPPNGETNFGDRVASFRRLLDLASNGHAEFLRRFDRCRSRLKAAEEFRANLAHGHLYSPAGPVTVLRYGRPDLPLATEDLETFPQTVNELELELLFIASVALKFIRGVPPDDPALDPRPFRTRSKAAQKRLRRQRTRAKPLSSSN